MNKERFDGGEGRETNCGELEDPIDKDPASGSDSPRSCRVSLVDNPGRHLVVRDQKVRSVRLLTTLSVIHNMHTIHKASIEPIK